jgi:hypothetical protein
MYPGAQKLRNRFGKNAIDLANQRRTQCPDAFKRLSLLSWD